MTTPNIPIEGPYAPQVDDLYALLNHALDQQAKDNLTRRQEVLTQSIAYIKRTKQVVNSLHEIIELHKEVQKQQKELLRHCAAYIREPKTRNKDLILKAIEQHLENKP